MGNKYTIGIDYGTLSARAVLTNVASGEVLCDSVYEYPHAVMDTLLCDEIPLPPDFALQHPMDYIEAFGKTVSDVIGRSGVAPTDIIGVGIDFTCCTLMPVYADGTPLCFNEKFKNEPHAYVKLWKHHSAQPYADRFNAELAKQAPELLARYGGKTSAEWLFPKIMETLDKAPEVYENAAYFVEAADFLSWLLTSKHTVGYAMASYKALYTENGYPDTKILTALDTRLENVMDKLDAPVVPLCKSVGGVSAESRERFGVSPDAPWLAEGTAVASPIPDAHCSAPVVSVIHSGDMFASFGTSSNYMLLSDKYSSISGICGVVKDGMVPGYYTYESGLCCFGDHFAWAAQNLCGVEYVKEAEQKGISPLTLLSQKAERLAAGESGVMALNWWNGNRNTLIDSSLSGMFIGMTLRTRPEELFRALVEANAFGTRVILENFERHGVEINKLAAVGGITRKSPFVMQLLADVLGKEIYVSNYIHSAALGASIFAAVAAGKDVGGYDTLEDACEAMAVACDTSYKLNADAKAVYDKLYAEYLTLFNYFGKENRIMKRLREISAES